MNFRQWFSRACCSSCPNLSTYQPATATRPRKLLFPSTPSSTKSISTVQVGVKQMAAQTTTGNGAYTIVERGQLYSLDYRVYYRDSATGALISPWHDIPLRPDGGGQSPGVYNMVVEIPRWTNAKMEIATKEPGTPIKQDVKGGEPRYVHNVFPHKGYIWNYGALPQTWEDPAHIDENTNAKGDNDPIDVIEIGQAVHPRGSVLHVKILGCLALLDEGETDWKLVALDINDPLAPEVNNIGDVERHWPGLLTASHEWFRIYKRPAGKPNNEFAFNGRFKDADFATKIIEQTHRFWKKLVTEERDPKLNTECRVPGAVFTATSDKWQRELEVKGPETSSLEPRAIPPEVDKWHFIRD